MALKFLNKKGWHTGSLRNIENVWKAEQKHEAEQKKLEELRKQIQEERERDEFRLLQEQAGILPRQERLEFLYDSGLAVGKGSTEGVVFKALDKPNEAASSSASSAPASASGTPGALFEEKPHSVNDAWRKLHSDPLLLIRQREQDALARIKNNPVQMAMIRKSVLAKNKDKDNGEKEREKKHHKHSSKRKKHSSSSEPADSDDASHKEERARKNSSTGRSSYRPERHRKEQSDSEEDKGGRESRKKYRHNDSKRIEQAYSGSLDAKHGKEHNRDLNRRSEHEKYHSESRSKHDTFRRESRSSNGGGQYSHNTYAESMTESQNKRWKGAPKLSEEARAARLREMQMDAEVHEEQRWKRLKRAEEDDARELKHNASSRGRNFLDAAHRSVYGAEKGGSSTIEESVRRRTYYSQGRSEGGESNAFRR